MAINSFWRNPFGQNVADAGLTRPVSSGTPYWDRPVGIFGDTPARGGGLFGASDPEEKRDMLMAAAATMLSGSGWSPTRRSSAEILGQALLAGQQARAQAQDRKLKQRYMEAQIAEMERARATQSPFGAIDPDQFTPESLAQFQKTGDYGVLVPRGGLSGIGNFNPGDYTPASFAKFLKTQDPSVLERYVTPANPTVQVVNGVPTVVQPDRGGGAPVQHALSDLPSEAAAGAAKAAAEAEAKATGSAAGEAEGSKLKKGVAAESVLGLLDIADPLIDAATGSVAGAAADKLAGAFGHAPKGAEAIAQLKVIQAGLMLNMPRMEGPQSDRDVQLYREAAASLGDPEVPRAIKKAAVRTIRQIQEKYRDAGRQVPRIVTGSEGAQNDANHIQSLIDKYTQPR